MPQHVAIIMDGNGRWAEREGVSRIKGHTAGMEAMKEIVRKSSHMGIKYLTVYAFSTENWKRTMEEVSGIFKLLVRFVKLDLSELDEENVRVRVLGDYSVIPDAAKKAWTRRWRLLKTIPGCSSMLPSTMGAELK